ncbi:MAG: adenylyl-sulfate kinase [Paludibacterium sp.]|uniref:adenylyl-sulfate kinase n=1 Tax=Paludibacterium sp. TaxID=1917523 RepID=UPI0025E90CA6|nr:adenylyl-sulfate kinase [Paludibacterium sp.]MBV8048074.1 adenylyl-sulfate kinase [Paludibacterium sp.]MBV8646957.1 adenylyl-sulfate kinase [Paludibacterium sp.]
MPFTNPKTLWLTGLSAAGKTTLAHALCAQWQADGVVCHLLDGDEVRRELCADLGFSRADRCENIRRVAERCRELNAEGLWVAAALISPYIADRHMAREIIGPDRFVEIYMSTSLAVCEARDPKGLYRKARAGEIPAFTGVSDPYEAPLAPDLCLDTARHSVEACRQQVFAWLAERPFS